MVKEFSYIGKSLRRIDAPAKVTGKTRFLTDMVVNGMVFATPVYSPIPYGQIINIDLSNVQKVDGYIDSVFAHHIPGENQVGVIIQDQPVLVEKIVHYVGDVIGVVIAESESAAQKSASKIQIEYEEFEPFLSIDESKAATENFFHTSNSACSHTVKKGNIEKGFKQADLIIEETFKTPYQEHYYLEPQGCIAIPEDDGTMILYGSLQCPYYVQKAVAKVLGLSLSQVRVIQAPTGGAFGGKEDIPSEVCARTALAAFRVHRPVKMVYCRRDDVQMTSKRHPFQMRYKIGVTQGGKLIAADILLEENAGAYATLSSVVSYRAAMQSMGPYVIPNIRVTSTAYYTNLPPAGAFRGFGSPQVTFGHERIMDIIAEKLGLDPVEFRLKNIIKPGNATLTNHQLVVSVGAEETLRKAEKAANWFHQKQKNKYSNRWIEGIGIATCHYGNCLGAAGWSLDGAGVKIQVHRDGSIGVAFGLVEMGQGAMTVVAQMAAEALGVKVDRITILPTDSQNVQDSGPSVASRVVLMIGNAILDAAQKLLPIFTSAAAELLKCETQHIKIKDDLVIDKQSGATLNFDELTDYLYMTNRSMDVVGWWHVPPLKYDSIRGLGEAYFTYSYATHIAKVKVDTLTGQVKVEKIWAAHDVGKVINPAGVEGQVEGGTTQGIGWALLEDFKIEGGKVTTPNLSTYLLPTILDVDEVETIIIEEAEPQGPWGAKGVGEPAIIPTAAAIANAVSNAIGVPMNELPMTPEKVLNAIQTARLNPSYK